MSFESPKNEGEQMGFEEAQEEANLMRAKMEGLRGRKPTVEDYDKTLLYIEELKKIAEDEPTFNKIMLKLLQFNSKYLSPEGIVMEKFVELIFGKSQLPYEISRNWEAFDNAAERLKKLREKAQKFEGK